MTRLNPTSLQFLQAFRELRKHDWPAMLDDLPTETIRYRLVRLHAVPIARGYRPEAKTVQRPPVIAPVPPLYCAAMQLSRRSRGHDHLSRPLGLDRKRLAAGERDND